jgi:hypothetical protein
MRNILVALVLMFAVSCGQPAPKIPELDKTFSGFCFTVSYPGTYILKAEKDGIIIDGNFRISIKLKPEPKSKKGGVIQLRYGLEMNNKNKKIQYNHIKTGDMEMVKMEGLDDMDRYTFGLFVPINGGVVVFLQEPAYMNEPLSRLAHNIAESFKVTDYDWFTKK